jgi:hypothetical protein
MATSDTWADRLVLLAVDLRPNGARRWDHAGIRAAIRKVQHLALADVALAVIRAADDRTLETPAPIGNPKAHCWRERATDRPQEHAPYDHGTACGICDQSRTRCEANPHSEHTYEPKPIALTERVAGEHAGELVTGLRDRVAKAQHIESTEPEGGAS